MHKTRFSVPSGSVLATIAGFAVLIGSCSLLQQAAMPAFAIHSVAVDIADGPAAGPALRVDLENLGSESSERLVLYFLLFDGDSSLEEPEAWPSFGSNDFRSEIDVSLPAGERTELLISIEADGEAPPPSIVVGNLFLREVVFADGRTWSNPLGLWAWSPEAP